MEFENKPLLVWPLGPLDPFAKGFMFLGLHLLFPPEHGLRPVGKVHHPTLISHPHPRLESEKGWN